MRRDDGGEYSGEKVDVKIEGRDSRLNIGVSALRVLFAQHDGGEVVIWVMGCLLGKVFFADQIEYEVRLGDNDAAERDGEGKECGQQPQYLASSVFLV